MILVIDNYDSFVHNLARYLREESGETLVIRNDEWPVSRLLELPVTGVVLSPGPKTPVEAGVCLELLRKLPLRIPVLGVCLGHQCLIAAAGGEIVKARRPLHGEAAQVFHDASGVLASLPSPFAAGRYHSLVGRSLRADCDLVANAWSEEGDIMGVRHVSAPRHGVQFHPESLLTPSGRTIVRNFLKQTEVAT